MKSFLVESVYELVISTCVDADTEEEALRKARSLENGIVDAIAELEHQGSIGLYPKCEPRAI